MFTLFYGVEIVFQQYEKKNEQRFDTVHRTQSDLKASFWVVSFVFNLERDIVISWVVRSKSLITQVTNDICDLMIFLNII